MFSGSPGGPSVRYVYGSWFHVYARLPAAAMPHTVSANCTSLKLSSQMQNSRTSTDTPHSQPVGMKLVPSHRVAALMVGRINRTSHNSTETSIPCALQKHEGP
eukprot:2431504-Rhodomonas_salina.2